ncbi:MAG TPA: tetratricopeptide repeat protein, partial [Alphaproteobacteria bacterium]|nr:tetratricopeptide repeat protein [Alphaproteobacteria bacterium]
PAGQPPVGQPAVAQPVAATAAPPALPTAAPPPTPPMPVVPTPEVKLRTGSHRDYGRLAFDWGRPVDYTMERDGGTVTLRFAAPGVLDQPANLKVRNVGGLRVEPGETLTVELAVPPEAPVRHFRNEKTVVLDVRDPPAGTPPAVMAKPAPPQQPVQAPAPQPGAPPATATAAPPAGPAVATATPAPAAPAKTPPEPAGAKPPIPAPAAQPAPTAPAATPAAPAPRVAAAPQPPARDGILLRIDPQEPASLAVYARSGSLWLVFDRQLVKPADELFGEAVAQVGGGDAVLDEVGTVVRLRLPEGRSPIVDRDGTAWLITLAERPELPLTPLTVKPEPDFPLGARVLVAVEDADRVISVEDPEVGDRLMVVPLPAPGRAVVDRHRFPEAEIMPAAQGVVVRPIGDAVQVQATRQGIEIAAPQGLALSPRSDKAGAAAPSEADSTVPRLFELSAWRRGEGADFVEQRRRQVDRIIEAPDQDKDRLRLDMARFFFAHGYANEALGLMNAVTETVPALLGRSEFLALRGAALIAAADPAGGLADLADPRLAEAPEAALWRGYAKAQTGDWQGAAPEFAAGAPLLAIYPDPYFQRLTLAAAETRLRNGDPQGAMALIDRLIARTDGAAQDSAAVLFLRGLVLSRLGEEPAAAEMWERAIASGDQLYRVRSSLELTRLQRAKGQIEPGAAADRLARLRFTWRGDDIELDLLQQLAGYQIEAGEIDDGLNTYRETIALFSESPRVPQLTEQMTEAFVGLYLDPERAKGVTALRALELYDKFGELTPANERGDRLVQALAERLVEIDLLDRAGNLLQHQVDYRLAGAEKARVGTRLAAIRLLDDDYNGALAALDRSEAAGLPPAETADRRLLRARALARLGRLDDAMGLLAEDGRPEAELLRIDLAWQGQKWPEVAEALGRLAGAPPAEGPPSAEAVQHVLNRASALALAKDTAGLKALREQWEPAMARTPDADAFRILTRSEAAGAATDLAGIQERVREVDMFRNVLTGYRQRATAAPEPQAAPQPQPATAAPPQG